MASGLGGPASKHSSAKSLGSFVELGSALSSEFEPVDLEDMELSAQLRPETDLVPTDGQRSLQAAITGKTATPPVATVRNLRSVPKQGSDKPSSGREAEGSSGAYEPIQDGIQNLENATQKAAEMAKEFTNKLFTSSAAEARSSVMRLAGDVSSWWAALDPVPKQANDSAQETSRSAQGSSEVQDLFGLPEDEEMMERFSCTLVQTMECNHNDFSKPQQVRSLGKLYITDRHSCFTAEGIRFAISHRTMNAAKKLAGTALRIDFGEGNEHVVLDSFRGSDLESALGLLEHVSGSA